VISVTALTVLVSYYTHLPSLGTSIFRGGRGVI
jgi:hypothetical protein